MLSSIRINLHIAKFSVYSVVLRGVRTTEELTPQRMRYVGLSGVFLLAGIADLAQVQWMPLVQTVSSV